ncbi:MAG TPA: anthranilate synthase component I family protein [Puia sp.]|nr:anthranilate synthase component I family protein [Puia sp.]
MLSWASRFNICCFLDNHTYQLPAHSVECLLGAGALRSVRADAGNAFDQLKEFTTGQRDWLFGHFAYGLTKETEPIDTGHLAADSPAAAPDPIGFPDLFFFVPEILIELSADSIRIGSCQSDHAAILEQIGRMEIQAPVAGQPEPKGAERNEYSLSGLVTGSEPADRDQHSRSDPPPPLALHPRFTRDEYLATVTALRQHILRGDCYEINFCQEFFAHPAHIDPILTWFSLSRASPNPFAAFYRLEESYLLCASPERYLKRTGDTLLSQPIKGTSPRLQGSPAQDRAGRDELYNSAKDRSENVMIVDLVRNDLSKICLPGSVRVEELYGIYSFPQVHQMISSVKGELPPETHWTEAVRATFPMGSMTGAPKKRVVGLIDQYERSPRGLFSGALGYVSPDGNFDFNVVIRSILYNRKESYLAYQVGSGITFYSDPLAEYEECLLKAEGILKALFAGGALF